MLTNMPGNTSEPMIIQSSENWKYGVSLIGRFTVPSNHGRSTCPRPGVGAQILVPLNFSAAVVPLLDPAGGLSFQDSLLPTPVKKCCVRPCK